MIDASDILEGIDNVLIFAGAGMSHELGIATYWTGPEAKYASTVSEYGYTALEHSTGTLWLDEPISQALYFHDTSVRMDEALKSNLANSSYTKLLGWLTRNEKDYFVVTSNVDSAFLRAGFDSNRLYEVHGSYRNSQCLQDPSHGVFATDLTELTTACPICESLSRPNVVFFDDFWVNKEVEEKQQGNHSRYMSDISSKSNLILELGVGTTVPRIREMANKAYYNTNSPYIHVNPTIHPWNSVMQILSPNKPSAPEIWVQETIVDGFTLLKID